MDKLNSMFKYCIAYWEDESKDSLINVEIMLYKDGGYWCSFNDTVRPPNIFEKIIGINYGRKIRNCRNKLIRKAKIYADQKEAVFYELAAIKERVKET